MRKRRYLTTEAELYDYAVGALGRRMRSVAELKRLMRQRVPRPGPDSETTAASGEELIDRVVARLKDQRYLNDAGFAAAYSAFRKDNEKFGRRRVISDLKVKGVHADVIEKAVEQVYDGVNEEQLARNFLRRKRMQKPKDQKQAARIFRALVRAGFSPRTIFPILKKWDVDDETLGALEEEI